MSLLFLVLLTALLVAQSTASCATARREIRSVTPIYCACPAKSHDSLWGLVGPQFLAGKCSSMRATPRSVFKCTNSRQTLEVLNEETSRSPQQVNRATPEHPRFVQGFSTAHGARCSDPSALHRFATDSRESMH
jgi:hypothetical protein